MDRAPGPDTIVILIGTADIEAITAEATTALVTMDVVTTALATMDVATTGVVTMDVVTTGIAGGAARVHA